MDFTCARICHTMTMIFRDWNLRIHETRTRLRPLVGLWSSPDSMKMNVPTDRTTITKPTITVIAIPVLVSEHSSQLKPKLSVKPSMQMAQSAECRDTRRNPSETNNGHTCKNVHICSKKTYSI